MTRESLLGKLIASLQEHIKQGSLDRKAIFDATEKLSKLGYRYDNESFPPLLRTEPYIGVSSGSPANLAEALIWKLGKWKVYKKFCKNYSSPNPEPSDTDVVFYAFAMHLKDKENPIYDQHALRSLWAICGQMTHEERQQCKSVLFDGSDKWKQSGTGKHAIGCYRIFVRYINDVLNGKDSSKAELDHLLMPLGQAIKKSTKTYAEFDALCGLSSSG